MAGEPPHLLVLGGTEEAYALAEALAPRSDLRVTTSLSGATREPRLPEGSHRIGGFGGVDGLARFIREEGVGMVLDASHPFATRITAAARAAATAAGIAYRRLERPPWSPVAGDRWHEVAGLDEALTLLPGIAGRVFAALGIRHVERLAASPLSFVLRGIEPPTVLPANVVWLFGRGPFTTEGETALMRDHAIDAVLCRNSGGEGARAKLEAARALGLPVVMIRRPEPPAEDALANVAEALQAVDEVFLRRSTWL